MTITDKIAIVVVTYNRPGLLAELLESITRLDTQPFKLIVVNNASTDDTADVLERSKALFPPDFMQVYTSETNTGGSGGFSKGVELAVAAGADWAWVMDDDVEVLPEALDRFAPWMKRFKVIHGRRYDFDGSPFYWQARFNQFLGVPLPYTIQDFNKDGYAITNSGTFEGMLIATEVVRKIGLPDPRFFISWDDATYAWVASQYTPVVYVNEFVMKRKRQQRQVDLIVRHLNDSSPMVKYYMMRNRGYVARYFSYYGKRNYIGFGIGTFLTFGKEIVRLLLVEHSLKGFRELLRGLRDEQQLLRDPTWRPMPALERPS